MENLKREIENTEVTMSLDVLLENEKRMVEFLMAAQEFGLKHKIIDADFERGISIIDVTGTKENLLKFYSSDYYNCSDDYFEAAFQMALEENA